MLCKIILLFISADEQKKAVKLLKKQIGPVLKKEHLNVTKTGKL